MKDGGLREFLEKRKERLLFIAAAEGNSGDALLRKGLELYLEEGGYRQTGAPGEADIILIHGGGNIDDVWRCGVDLFRRLSGAYPETPIVVAPSTCHFKETDFEAVLNACRQEVHFFTREENSFKRLKAMRLNTNIRVYSADDTAFLLEGTKYLSILRQESRSDYTLFAFRTDRESGVLHREFDPHKKGFIENAKYRYLLLQIRTFVRREFQNAYRSGNSIVADPAHEDFDIFVSLVANAREIYTDRLHTGILGALLGKKVYLYPTRYDKIQGVYGQTLWRYPNAVKLF